MQLDDVKQATSKSREDRRLLRAAGIGIAAVASISAASLLGLASYVSKRISRPRRSHRPANYTFTPWEFGIKYRAFQLSANDDEFVDVWYLPQDDPVAPCILCLTGFASHKAEMLGIGSNLHRDGFAVMLIDFRGSGRSNGDMVTMGHRETDDARLALEWIARETPDAQIGVLGYSMGGSVALVLAATDERVGAVVSDSAFATQRSILAHHIKRKTGLWPGPIVAAAGPMLQRRHQRRYDDFAPSTLVHQISPRPVLQIHSRDDQVVPFEHAEEIWENARQPKEYWYPEGIGHCGAYFDDRPGYCNRVSSFFQKAFSNCQSENTGPANSQRGSEIPAGSHQSD
ncbi:MAG: alpha/beta fold hydrolase [Thermomicrobiaceae bacterium]